MDDEVLVKAGLVFAALYVGLSLLVPILEDVPKIYIHLGFYGLIVGAFLWHTRPSNRMNRSK